MPAPSLRLRMIGLVLLIALAAIVVAFLVLGAALSRYVAGELARRDAVVSSEFLNSVVEVEGAASWIAGETAVGPRDIEEFLAHVARMPDVFRANVYAATGEILWSSEPGLAGQRFPDNEGLAKALEGRIEPEWGLVGTEDEDEPGGFPADVTRFVEHYVPIRDGTTGAVVGAVEVYKRPGSLPAAIARVRMMTSLAAAAAATALFGTLAAVLVHAGRVLRAQEARVVEAERLAVVGDLASTVAHGLRNPLAAIRTTAEIALSEPMTDAVRGPLGDVLDQVDRLEAWIRSFLTQDRVAAAAAEAPVAQAVARCLEAVRPQIERRGIAVGLSGERASVARARPEEVDQMLASLISNGIEAMARGGRLDICWEREGGRIAIRVADSGSGIAPDRLRRLFVPFETGKAGGLGLGLALGRRLAERRGGTLELRNRVAGGAEATLTLPAA